MNFQARLTVALAVVAAVPLGVLGYGVRAEAIARLDAESARRVQAVEASLTGKLAEQVDADRRRLELLAAGLAGDNRFRIALSEGADRRWLLDWAPRAMTLAGFAVLQVQDSSGRILSSGQFRNDYDRVAPALPRAVAEWPQRAAVVDARTPDGTVRALVTTVATTVRGEHFTVTGGSAFDSTRVAALSADPSVAAVFAPGSREPRAESPKPIAESPKPRAESPKPRAESPKPFAESREPAAVTPLPYICDSTGAEPEAARIALIPDPAPMQALKADIARWLAIAMTLTLLVAALVAALFGRFISAPVTQLAERATKLERVAAMGDLARQVNHDIKNGLAPIRNVLRHLTQTAEQEPDKLAAIYGERRATLDAGMEYLDQLARNYAKLSPALTRGRTDARVVIREVARQASGGGAAVEVRVPDALPSVRADTVVLHRILDNLVSNAVDALDGKPGSVMIAAEAVGQLHHAQSHHAQSRHAQSHHAQPHHAQPHHAPSHDAPSHHAQSHNASPFVRLTVSDTGRGMSRDELDRAFNDFYTTKPSGTGLGLSVVRRLLTDVGGSLRADSAPGKGSTFTIEIPAETGDAT